MKSDTTPSLPKEVFRGLFIGMLIGLIGSVALYALAFVTECANCFTCGCFTGLCNCPIGPAQENYIWRIDCLWDGHPRGYTAHAEYHVTGIFAIWNFTVFRNVAIFCSIAGSIIGMIKGITEFGSKKERAAEAERQRKEDERRREIERKEAEERAKVEEKARREREKQDQERARRDGINNQISKWSALKELFLLSLDGASQVAKLEREVAKIDEDLRTADREWDSAINLNNITHDVYARTGLAGIMGSSRTRVSGTPGLDSAKNKVNRLNRRRSEVNDKLSVAKSGHLHIKNMADYKDIPIVRSLSASSSVSELIKHCDEKIRELKSTL